MGKLAGDIIYEINYMENRQRESFIFHLPEVDLSINEINFFFKLRIVNCNPLKKRLTI